jgi:serine/threonine-protein kinase
VHGEKPTLGRYRIERELGQGAMGTVYLGVDPKINRQVAIKTLAYSLVEPDQLKSVKERFFREAEAAGRLNHPKIVTIYDVGEEQDLAYLAMELLDGHDLSDYCQPKQLLEPVRVIQILKQIAQALDYAHHQGVIHRDIKPANIIILSDGQIKVADFGVARVVSSSQTETGIILGTPSYMSPEQVAGKKVDGRSDLFSLGVVMYELLSGVKPFQGESMGALMYNIANCSYRPLDEVRAKLPAECQAIVAKLLQKTLTRRFKSAGLLAAELENLQQRLENG